MRSVFLKIMTFSLLLILFACKKKVDVDYRPEFIGLWYCPADDYGSGTEDWRYYLWVDSNSNAVFESYYYQSGHPSYTKEGTARANDKHFKIGRTLSFGIIEYPYKIDTTSSNVYIHTQNNYTVFKKANWKMTLYNPTFHTGKGSYYKADY